MLARVSWNTASVSKFNLVELLTSTPKDNTPAWTKFVVERSLTGSSRKRTKFSWPRLLMSKKASLSSSFKKRLPQRGQDWSTKSFTTSRTVTLLRRKVWTGSRDFSSNSRLIPCLVTMRNFSSSSSNYSSMTTSSTWTSSILGSPWFTTWSSWRSTAISVACPNRVIRLISRKQCPSRSTFLDYVIENSKNCENWIKVSKEAAELALQVGIYHAAEKWIKKWVGVSNWPGKFKFPNCKAYDGLENSFLGTFKMLFLIRFKFEIEMRENHDAECPFENCILVKHVEKFKNWVAEQRRTVQSLLEMSAYVVRRHMSKAKFEELDQEMDLPSKIKVTVMMVNVDSTKWICLYLNYLRCRSVSKYNQANSWFD